MSASRSQQTLSDEQQTERDEQIGHGATLLERIAGLAGTDRDGYTGALPFAAERLRNLFGANW